MCKESNNTCIAARFDAFSLVCPYFTTKPWVNNGYGCTHPGQEEIRCDGDGNACGACYLHSCPLGYKADAEDLTNPEIDWGDTKLDPEDVEDEYIVVRTNAEPNAEERAAVEQYTKYINRYVKEETK